MLGPDFGCGSPSSCLRSRVSHMSQRNRWPTIGFDALQEIDWDTRQNTRADTPPDTNNTHTGITGFEAL